MRIVFGKDATKVLPHPRRVVTVGMFDGVHLGHRKTISTTVNLARELGCEAAVLTFDRHPASIVSGQAPPLITSLRHRLVLFEGIGPELCLVLHFDKELAATPAREFLEKILIGTLGARAVVLGEDSTFGKGGEGNRGFLERVGPDYGIETRCVPLVRLRDRVVSSTAVREAIAAGDLESAEAMLGRRVSLLGTVVHGDHLGAEIGFPTANLDLHHELRPPRGVYAGRTMVNGVAYVAVMNIGIRPTVGHGMEERVEVHLIGFDGDLREKNLEVQLVRKLRDEKRFDTLEDLTEQIRNDCAMALRLQHLTA